MGKTRYKRVVEFLEKMKSEKGENVKKKIFFSGFIMYVGDDARTRKSAIKMMKDLNLIQETDDGILIR